ncbi:cathepsin W-like isoform X1 [Ornithorhynchus anatinus]|uniref:cathepsin W-like isoform X1 n=1 Tax=Ornithorhynchus anatinus TaxID=9258 RepID=UPI0010A8725F|nr:cathepsin W-like isoform X1 [Ornithorhynchus anatinus]
MDLLALLLPCLLAQLGEVATMASLGPGGQDQHPKPLPDMTLELMDKFKDFQIRYNKSYEDQAEYVRRFKIFVQNLARARKLQEEDVGTAEYGVTPFSDLSEEEFLSLYAPRFGMPSGWANQMASIPEGPLLKETCDWRKRGAITSVKNQGSCGSCWAFAAVGNAESMWYLRAGKRLVSLSVQEVLDCGRCRDGCQGGYPEDAFITMWFNRGLASEKDYPYKVRARPNRCQANKTRAAWIHDFITLPKDEMSMARYVADNGPIVVSIKMPQLQLYVGGVMHPSHHNCDPKSPHSILLVGFGFSNDSSHWILKNSWGPEWGEKGYFRLHRGSNACGIADYPITALVKGSKRRVSCPP